jgi:hypothetical protein
VIPHHPIGDGQQPRSDWLTGRYLLEPTPGDSKDLGSSVLAVGGAETPKAVPVYGEIVIRKERVEVVSQVDMSW